MREIERQNALIKELLNNDALMGNKRTLTAKGKSCVCLYKVLTWLSTAKH